MLFPAEWKEKLRSTVSKKMAVLLVCCSLLTGLGQALGTYLSGIGPEHSISRSALLLLALLSGLVFFLLAACCAGGGYVLFKRQFSLPLSGEAPLKTWQYQLLLLAAWLPCFLAYYPAIYSYDAEPQLFQYLTHAFDDQHPLLHTLLLGKFYDLGVLLRERGLRVDGMAFYTLLQMAVLSFALAKLMRLLAALHCRRRCRIFFLLYLMFFPMHPLMAVTTTKDAIFTAFLVLMLVALTHLTLPQPETREDDGKAPARQQQSLRETVLRHTPYVLLALCMMLFRKNGVYMMAVLLMVLLLFVLQNRRTLLYRRLFFATLAAILAFLVLHRGMLTALRAAESQPAEALSIPLQQMARSYASHREQMTADGDLARLTVYESEEGLRGYRPYISDAVKQGFDNAAFSQNPAGFFSLWAHLLAKYPGTYVAAALYHTMGAWYPADVSHTLVYRDWWRNRIAYYMTDDIPVFREDRFVQKENLLPPVRRFYEWFATDCIQLRFLPLQLLFSPFLYCMGTFWLTVTLLVQKRRRHLIVSLPLFANFLIVLMGPCIISRYLYPFMALLPLLIALVCTPPPVREKSPGFFRKAPAREPGVPEASGAYSLRRPS